MACKERFTTYESAELMLPRLVKNDGSRVPFEEQKLRAGMLRALEKRPVAIERVETAISRIYRLWFLYHFNTKYIKIRLNTNYI